MTEDELQKTKIKTNTKPFIQRSKTQKLKEELQSSTTASTFDSKPVNYGERLYRKSLALDEVRAKGIKKIKVKDEKSFNKKCSFRPKTNIDTSTLSSSSISFMKRLDTLSSFTMHHTHKITTEQAKEKAVLRDFHKYNNKRLSSDKIEANTERLFNEKKVLEKTKADLTAKVFHDVYPFQPQINDTSTPTVHNFFVRLQNWVDTRNTEIQQQTNSLPIDYVTNQVLFTPKINEYQLNRNGEAHVYLHNEQKMKEQKHQEIKENMINQIIAQSNMPKISANSQMIIEKQKNKVFNALFDFLLIDQSIDNIKHSDSIREKLNVYFTIVVMKEFDPLLTELKESNETLNRKEFVAAMDKLYCGMPFDAKREIMSFNPNLNPK